MNVQTYLFFDGCCEQAIELYKHALHADVTNLVRFSDAPDFLRSTDRDLLVYHSTVRIGETNLNMSDDPTNEHGSYGGFALLVHLDSSAAVDTATDILATGGSVRFSPQKTFWALRYSIVTDPFGVTWKLQASDE